MLTLFFAFLIAPVNPHLSKYIFTLKWHRISQVKIENA